jgi:hypothetical protein
MSQPNNYAIPTEAGISPERFAQLLARLENADRPARRRLWNYYRNPMLPCAVAEENGSERPYRQAQEWGMPPRITGYHAGQTDLSAHRNTVARKEVVVENDIAWRVEAMVDHLFGKSLILVSTAADPRRRDALTRLATAILETNGGLTFLQDLAVLGAVHGFVDIVVKLDAPAAAALRKELNASGWSMLASETVTAPTTAAGEGAGEGEKQGGGSAVAVDVSRAGTGPGKDPNGRLIERLARLVRFEIVHPLRSLPLSSASSATGGAYAQVWEETTPASDPSQDRRRWWQRATRSPSAPPGRVQRVELLTATRWWRLTDGQVVDGGDVALGRLPVVHVQNLATPFEYAGRSDVEPLIPLQDELNTRLSDRAYRITMQSFKMFLGKGIDNFLAAPVGPGRMWSTDNEDAKVEEFGGDAPCPSEESHISDLRDAMDKTSGVPPVAAGTIRDKIGSLSSAAALRVTLQALMAKTERKRATYGRGVAELTELALAWLDAAGLLPTGHEERGVDLSWPDVIPDNTIDALREAQIKAELGVPRETVLREIGY